MKNKFVTLENLEHFLTRCPFLEGIRRTFYALLRWYLTLQGDNSIKSAKRFNDIVLLRNC